MHCAPSRSPNTLTLLNSAPPPRAAKHSMLGTAPHDIGLTAEGDALSEKDSAKRESVVDGRNCIYVHPSLPLTTTFPLWKTALRPEVTQPSPPGSSELAGASMVQSGVWRVPTSWKTGLRPEDNVLRGSSSRVQPVIRQVLEVQSTTVGPEGCLWAHSGRRHWWPYPLSLSSHSGITHSPGGLKTPSTLHSRSGSTAS
jgi:hypothetical protein